MSDPAPRWLSDDEMAAWLPLVRLLGLLPQALDRQLREEAGISHVYYQLLALLSAEPDDALRMSELARRSGTRTRVSRRSSISASGEGSSGLRLMGSSSVMSLI